LLIILCVHMRDVSKSLETLGSLTLAFYLSVSLKVTGTDTDQLATYDFLLVINSNYGPILGLYCTVSEINSDFN